MNDTLKSRIWRALNSTGFYVSLAILGLGVYASFPQDIARNAIYGAAALVGGAFAIRGFIKTGTVDLWGWAKNPNTWTSLGAVINYIFPQFPVDLLNQGDDIATAVNNRDLNGLLLIILPLISHMYFLIVGKKPPTT